MIFHTDTEMIFQPKQADIILVNKINLFEFVGFIVLVLEWVGLLFYRVNCSLFQLTFYLVGKSYVGKRLVVKTFGGKN